MSLKCRSKQSNSNQSKFEDFLDQEVIEPSEARSRKGDGDASFGEIRGMMLILSKLLEKRESPLAHQMLQLGFPVKYLQQNTKGIKSICVK